MYWETMPTWFWIGFYLFLLTTLATAILNIMSKKLKMLSIVAVVLTFSIPVVQIINSVGRSEGINEIEHWITQLQLGSFWAIYVLIGFIYLLAWWIIFCIKSKTSIKTT